MKPGARESPARAGIMESPKGAGDICCVPSAATQAPKNSQRGRTRRSEGTGQQPPDERTRGEEPSTTQAACDRQGDVLHPKARQPSCVLRTVRPHSG